jgi:hypothetical protein
MATSKESHWLLRVGDGIHFTRSQKFRRWGIDSKHTWAPAFMRRVRPGDCLWFIQGNSGGKIIGVATFTSCRPRELGPLFAVTPTNEELGWVETDGGWDTEVHYENLYDVSRLDLLTKIKSPLTGRLYNPEKCAVDLPHEYKNIVRYSQIVRVPDSA